MDQRSLKDPTLSTPSNNLPNPTRNSFTNTTNPSLDNSNLVPLASVVHHERTHPIKRIEWTIDPCHLAQTDVPHLSRSIP